MNLFDQLHLEVHTPNRPAIVLDGKAVSRQALHNRVEDLSDRLAAAGVVAGDCIGIAIRNPLGYLSVVLALVRLGAVSALFNPAWPEAERQDVRRRYRVKAVAADAFFGPSLLKQAAPAVLTAAYLFGPRPSGLQRASPVADADPLPWAYTTSSGTTGMPKTIVRTQGRALASLHLRKPRPPAGARVMLLNEMSMVWSLTTAIQTLHAGATVVLSSNPHADALLDRMAQDGVTHLVGSTDMVTKLAWYCQQQRPGAFAASGKMHVNVTGSALNDKAREVITAELAANLVLTYASSEGGVIAWLDDADARGGTGTNGWVLDGVEVQALDATGQPMPPGNVGKLRIRSAGMAAGYLGEAGELLPFTDGWFVSDDVGSVDDSGCLRLFGRESDVINIAGRKIDALIIEHAIESHPDVIEAAVTGMQMAGKPFEVMVALVVSRRDLSIKEVASYLKTSFLAEKIPEFVVRVRNLPRNSMGKLMRNELPSVVDVDRTSAT
jgi:acyl-coenzyme A synthetase/AMP-(fatty) acid ligase